MTDIFSGSIKLFFFLFFLQPVDPEYQAVVAIASSKDVVFQGGPQPWVLDSSKFFHTCMSVASCCVSYCYGFVLRRKW